MGRQSLAWQTAEALRVCLGHGPFTTSEAQAVGVSLDRLRAAVRAGAVTRERRGVFYLSAPHSPAPHSPAPHSPAPHSPAPHSPAQHSPAPHSPGPRASTSGYVLDDAAIAMAHLVKGAALSHASAARFHGLPVPPSALACGHITLPGGRSRMAGTVQVHAQKLPQGHAIVVRGTRVTTLARTAIDLARTSALPEGLICMDAVMRRLVASHAEDAAPLRLAVHDDEFLGAARADIADILRDMSRWPGTVNAQRALALSDPAAESALESHSRGLILEYGVPAPECGYPIDGADGGLYWADMAWVGARVIGECDGLSKYTDPSVLHREKLRQEALERAGWRVVRWTYADILRAPQRVVDRVRQALAL